MIAAPLPTVKYLASPFIPYAEPEWLLIKSAVAEIYDSTAWHVLVRRIDLF